MRAATKTQFLKTLNFVRKIKSNRTQQRRLRLALSLSFSKNSLGAMTPKSTPSKRLEKSCLKTYVALFTQYGRVPWIDPRNGLVTIISPRRHFGRGSYFFSNRVCAHLLIDQMRS